MSIKKAVIDRIVDKKAVLLVGNDEVEALISLSLLPNSVKEGDWLKVTFEEDDIVTIQIDRDETAAVKERVQNKMDLLRQRGSSLLK